jgi:outer membrane usher protein
MWTARGAPVRAHLVGCFRGPERAKKVWISSVLLFLLFAGPLACLAREVAVLSVSVNREPKGEFFVLMEDGDFLVRVEDLKAMGLREIRGGTLSVEGERYVSLNGLKGVRYDFDERTLTLALTASPSLLPEQTVDFARGSPGTVYYPEDTSAFLNYALSYTDSTGPHADVFALTNQLGLRARGVLALTDSLYTHGDQEDRFVRLLSRLVYDWRGSSRRLVTGDFITTPGDFRLGLNMGGVSFSKEFSIDPYFVTYPRPALEGSVELPSELEVSVDGRRILTDRFSPGEFHLKNISSTEGASTVEVVLRDPFGRERTIVQPVYFTRELLKPGVHEYSYNLGILRRNFGLESSDYGGVAFSAFHRVGLTRTLTLGYSAEAAGDVYRLSPRAKVLLGHFGIADVSASASRGSGQWGVAGLLRYSYVGRTVSGRFSLAGFTRAYAVPFGSELDKPRYSFSAGLGFNLWRQGNLTFGYSDLETFQGNGRSAFAAAYTRPLPGRNTYLTARLDYVQERDGLPGTESSYTFFVGVSHLFNGTHVSFETELGEDRNAQRLEVQRNVPFGEGLSYRASVQRREVEGEEFYTTDPYVQYNGRHGVLQGSALLTETENGDFHSYRLALSGALVYVGGEVGVTRPVRDSFGLVKVGTLEGVHVEVNNQDVGTTDEGGRLFVPDLGSYVDTQVSIRNEDIPMDYDIGEEERNVSPPYRSGTLLSFRVEKFQAVTGFLAVETARGTVPLEFYDVTVQVGDKQVEFPTGRDGEFYVENVPPGTYKASLRYKGRVYAFSLTVPETEDVFIDLGTVVVGEKDARPASGAGGTAAPDESPKEPAAEAASPDAAAPEAPEAPAYYVGMALCLDIPARGFSPSHDMPLALRRMARVLRHSGDLKVAVQACGDGARPGADVAEEYLVARGFPRASFIPWRREARDGLCGQGHAALAVLRVVFQPEGEEPCFLYGNGPETMKCQQERGVTS